MVCNFTARAMSMSSLQPNPLVCTIITGHGIMDRRQKELVI